MDTETFAHGARRSGRQRRAPQNDSDDDSDDEGTSYFSNGHDFPSMIADLFRGINWKVAFFLSMVMLVVFSDTYMENVLESVPGAVISDRVSTNGTVMQIATVVVCYIILDLLVQGKFL